MSSEIASKHDDGRYDALNTQQRAFVEEYLNHFNKRQAAIKAGYEPDYGNDLLKKPEIIECIKWIQNENSDFNEMLRKRIVQEWLSMGFSNIQDFAAIVAPEQLAKMPRYLTAAVQEVRTTTRRERDGDSETTVNVKLYSKDESIKMLAKFAGMDLDPKVKHSGSVALEIDDVWDIKDPTKE